MQHAIERVGRPCGSHEGVGREKEDLHAVAVVVFLGLDLLQNGGITSGNDVFFVVLWTLHGNAKYLVMMLWTRRSNVVVKTHLLHARHLQVNLDGCGATLFFLDVHVVCQQQQTNLFFCQTAFCIFWKLHVVLQQLHGREECFWNFEMFLERLR